MGPQKAYLGSLLERLLVDGHQDDRMRAHAVPRGRLHVFDQVFALAEIAKGLGAQLLGHFLFVFTRVDGDDMKAHCLCVLAR